VLWGSMQVGDGHAATHRAAATRRPAAAALRAGAGRCKTLHPRQGPASRTDHGRVRRPACRAAFPAWMPSCSSTTCSAPWLSTGWCKWGCQPPSSTGSGASCARLAGSCAWGRCAWGCATGQWPAASCAVALLSFVPSFLFTKKLCLHVTAKIRRGIPARPRNCIGKKVKFSDRLVVPAAAPPVCHAGRERVRAAARVRWPRRCSTSSRPWTR
jgi:hypothetical protein